MDRDSSKESVVPPLVRSDTIAPADREIEVPSGRGNGNALFEFFDRNLKSKSLRTALLALDKDAE